VLLSIGPADEYMSEFCAAMREAGTRIVSGLSPLRLSALLSLCDLYIGSDSGVSHLAAAVGIPAICVFGPTDPDVWAPQGKNAVAVRRRWNPEDVIKWAPSERPDFQDEEIIKLIRHYLSNATSTHTTHSA
jgi:ADP-heptose:LPS heptosyltransferase